MSSAENDSRSPLFRPFSDLLGDILPIVLARLGVGGVQSAKSGEDDLT